MIKKYLQEPLLHFLVLGGLLFLLYATMNDGFTEAENRVVISEAKIAQLSYIWQKKQMRKPSEEELQQIIEGEIYNEIMSREALKLGLDKNDGIIRRRLVQKMTFVSSNFASLVTPTDTQLKRYLSEHQKEFLSSEQITFTLQSDVLINKENKNMQKWEVSRVYGKAFAEKVFMLRVGEWHQDVPSPYGKVAIFVKEKTAGKVMDFEHIKPQLKSAWQLQEKEKLDKNFYETLKKEYSIKVEK